MKSISSTTPGITTSTGVEKAAAVGLRSEMEVRSMALEAIESELEAAEKTDLKRLKLLKVAWVVSIIVGTAIFFIIPISMMFGVPLWLPIVVSLGLSLVLGYTSGKISSKRQEILRRREFLVAYRQKLLSEGVKKPLIKKFDIKKEELFSGLKSNFQRRLEKIKNELLYGVKDSDSQDSCSTLNALDLQGETFAQRYQMQDLLLEEEGSRVASWQEFSRVVSDINNKLVKGECEAETLDSVSLSALMAGGVQHIMIPPKDFAEKLDRVQSLLKYGAQVISSVQEDFNRYDNVFFDQSVLKEFSPLPPAVKQFRDSSNLLLLDILGRIHSLEGLNEAVIQQEETISNIQKTIESSSPFEKLCSQVYQKVQEVQKLLSEGKSSQKYRTVFGSILSKLESLYRGLKDLSKFVEVENLRGESEDSSKSVEVENLRGESEDSSKSVEVESPKEESEDPKEVSLISGFLKELKECANAFKESLNTPKDQEVIKSLQKLLSRIQEGVTELPQGQSFVSNLEKLEKNQKILRKTQCDLVAKLSELGNESFLNKVRMGVRGCSAISSEINKAVSATPERKLFSCRLLLSAAKRRLGDSYWGVSGANSSEVVMKEKEALNKQLVELEGELETLETSFGVFKETQLSRLFLKESQDKLMQLVAMAASSSNESSKEDTLNSLKELSNKLSQIGSSQGILAESILVSPRELRDIVLKYGEFHQSIHAVLSKISSCVEEVGKGCDGKAISFRKLLFEKDSTLSERSARIAEEIQKVKETEQAALAKECQQPVKELLQEYLQKLNNTHQCMMDFEEAFVENEVVAEKAFSKADRFLESLGEVQNSTSMVQSVLKALSSSVEELSADQLLSDPGQSRGLRETDEKSLSRSVKEVKKIRNKLIEGLENLAAQAKKSLRTWNLSKSITTTVLSLCMFIAAIFLLNVQLWWLPLLFVGVGAVFIGINHVFDKVIERKTKAMVTEQVALKLSVQDCVTESDFGNKNVTRLAELQRTLGLDGCSRTWAQEIVKELENVTTGEEAKDSFATKSDAIKQLTSWKRELDKNMKKRFHTESVPTTKTKDPSFDISWQDRQAIQQREKELLANEDAIVGRLNRVQNLLQKIENERAFSTSLSSRVAQGKIQHSQNIRENNFYDSLIKHLTSSIEMAVAAETMEESSTRILTTGHSKSIIDLASQCLKENQEEKGEAIEAFDREVFMAMEKNTINDVLNSLAILCGSNGFEPSRGASVEVGGGLATSLSKIRRGGCEQLAPVVKVVFNKGKEKINEVIRAIEALLNSEGVAQGKTLAELFVEDRDSLDKVAVARTSSGVLSVMKAFEKKFSTVSGLRFATTKVNTVGQVREVFVGLNALQRDVVAKNKTEIGAAASFAKKRIGRLVYKEHVKFRKECKALRELCAYVEKSLQNPSYNQEGLLRNIIKKLSETPVYLLKEELSFNKARSLLVKQKIQEYSLLEEKSCFVKAIVSEKSKEFSELKNERTACENSLDELRGLINNLKAQQSLL
ncbi:hypothetical protein [Chlamydiifrater phoenicopteri]|uniref:hypothetical protein n=1 Tax=Chlamydiifrater phoenicopteri TaxID=2681469 RepID=UPI001BD04B78|nr:hypothetical protein [Chlamydiifrater phoenicopteri]